MPSRLQPQHVLVLHQPACCLLTAVSHVRANQQIVTNYHVLQSALAKFGASPNAPLSSSAPNPAVGKKVALVTLEVSRQQCGTCLQCQHQRSADTNVQPQTFFALLAPSKQLW